MESCYKSLKSYFTPKLVVATSSLLKEKTSHICNAMSFIIAGILELMVRNGDTPQIKETLEEAGRMNIFPDVVRICQEEISSDRQRIGDDFLEHLLGDRAIDFTGVIASDSQISNVSANKLISVTAPVIAGYLGNKLITEQITLGELINIIKSQQEDYMGIVPQGILSTCDTNGFSAVRDHSHTNVYNSSVIARPDSTSRTWLTLAIVISFMVIAFLILYALAGSEI